MSFKELYKDRDEFYDPDWSPALVAAADALVHRLKVANPDMPLLEDMDIDSRDHYIIAAQHTVRAFYKEAERPL